MNRSSTAHRILHWKSFHEFQARILEYKCKKCEKQKGFVWKEIKNHNLSTGHNIIYEIRCDNQQCNAILVEYYESSPRVQVEFGTTPTTKRETLKIKYCEKTVCKSKDTYCLYGLLQNIILLQHGTTNTCLQTMSATYDLPHYHPNTITRDKKCAAKILTFIAKKSIVEARQKEKTWLKTRSYADIVMRQSADGAYANRARMKSKFCYMFLVNQPLKLVTDYDILCILKHGYNIDPSEYNSKQLEHKLAAIMLPQSVKRVDKLLWKLKRMWIKTVGDKDIEWTGIKCKGKTKRTTH